MRLRQHRIAVIRSSTREYPFGRAWFRAAWLCLALLAITRPVNAAEPLTADAANDQAAERLREAIRAPSPAASLALQREALALLDIAWAQASTDWQRRRACFDRTVALSQLGRHTQALADFSANCPNDPPGYVLSALADSHAALNEPEAALERYRQALQADPANDAAMAGQLFALADLDRSGEAEAILAERLRQNPSLDDRLRLALLRAWDGRIDTSAAEVAALVAQSPDNAELARQQGGLELLRDRPFHALAAYDHALALTPGYLGAALDRVSVLDRLGRNREARLALQAVQNEAPDWAPLQRLRRSRRNDQGVSLESRVRAARGGTREVAKGEVRSETTFTSAVFGNDWRGYVAHRRAYADFRGVYLEDQRLAAGLNWFRNGLRLQAEIDTPRDRFVDAHGFAFSADWRASDNWSLAAAYARNAFDLPLRARGAGTTGDRYSAAIRYSPRGQFWARLSAGLIDYSDGNRHYEFGLSARRQFVLGPRWSLSINPALGIGGNRIDTVPYFSPRRDASAELSTALEQRLFGRLSHRHWQRLELFLGAYRQRDFGTEAMGGLRYEYRIDFQPGRSAFVRIGRDRRSYDGAAEFQTFAELGTRLSW